MKEYGRELTPLLTLPKESFNQGILSLTERKTSDIAVITPLFL